MTSNRLYIYVFLDIKTCVRFQREEMTRRKVENSLGKNETSVRWANRLMEKGVGMNAKWSRGDVCLQYVCVCMCDGGRGKRVPGKGGGATDRGEGGKGDVREMEGVVVEVARNVMKKWWGGGSKESATTAANPNPLPPPPRYWCHLSPRK